MERVHLENIINLLKNEIYKFSKIVVFSRDELKQHEMRENIRFKNKSKLRFLIGDVGIIHD